MSKDKGREGEQMSFPSLEEKAVKSREDDKDTRNEEKLSRRDHFAAMTLQGLVVNMSSEFVTIDNRVTTAVKFADALIRELDRTEKQE